jgi:DNA (cytosine-5)-methyltransferase 1
LKRSSSRAPHASGFFDELVIDNFAGGGGASIGIERGIGRAVDVAINHDREAVELHRVNHPHTLHQCEDVWQVDPLEVTQGRPVGLAWFSPDCKHFSRAKGGKPVSKKIRGLAWVVVKWAKAVQPRVIMLENVREFETWGPLVPAFSKGGIALVDRDGVQRLAPCPVRKGQTFRRWVGSLRKLGYHVEHRTLDSANFGAPTHRKRLFLVARNDGQPIVWPEPTHGPGRKPYRTAAGCIDWSLPCPSIFLTREEGRKVSAIRPLADKTMRRIAKGIQRYVIDCPKPFIVTVNHGGDDFRGQMTGKPLATITQKHGYGLITPFLTAQYGERPGQQPRSHAVNVPIPVITPRGGGGFPLIFPLLESVDDRSSPVTKPLGTITSVARPALIAPTIVQYNQEKANEVRGLSADSPLNVITTENRYALTAPHLTKFFGGVVGQVMDKPAPTITAVDHNGLVAANLIKMNFGDKQWQAVDEPLRTILAGANHHGLVHSFLTKYNGRAIGQTIGEPLHTITGNDRFGLVTIGGEPYQIADIGLRMLSPRELYRAQGFPENYKIEITINGRRLPKSAQVRMCGNSVSPPVAEALVRANMAVRVERIQSQC